MPEEKKSVEKLLLEAHAIYAQLVFAGCVAGWENIDLAIRSGASPHNKLAALRYEFASRIDDTHLSEKLREKILTFAESPGA